MNMLYGLSSALFVALTIVSSAIAVVKSAKNSTENPFRNFLPEDEFYNCKNWDTVEQTIPQIQREFELNIRRGFYILSHTADLMPIQSGMPGSALLAGKSPHKNCQIFRYEYTFVPDDATSIR